MNFNKFKNYAIIFEMTQDFIVRVGEEVAIEMAMDGMNKVNRNAVEAFLQNIEHKEEGENREDTISAILEMIPQVTEEPPTED